MPLGLISKFTELYMPLCALSLQTSATVYRKEEAGKRVGIWVKCLSIECFEGQMGQEESLRDTKCLYLPQRGGGQEKL